MQWKALDRGSSKVSKRRENAQTSGFIYQSQPNFLIIIPTFKAITLACVTVRSTRLHGNAFSLAFQFRVSTRPQRLSKICGAKPTRYSGAIYRPIASPYALSLTSFTQVSPLHTSFHDALGFSHERDIAQISFEIKNQRELDNQYSNSFSKNL